eukprot:6714260-Lingulodinium_polyedra.AAC.1
MRCPSDGTVRCQRVKHGWAADFREGPVGATREHGRATVRGGLRRRGAQAAVVCHARERVRAT